MKALGLYKVIKADVKPPSHQSRRRAYITIFFVSSSVTVAMNALWPADASTRSHYGFVLFPSYYKFMS